MKTAKKIFGSYAVSVPALVLGLVFLMQSRDTEFTVSADKISSGSDQVFAISTFLIVIGSIFILISVLSLLTKFLVKEK